MVWNKEEKKETKQETYIFFYRRPLQRSKIKYLF